MIGIYKQMRLLLLTIATYTMLAPVASIADTKAGAARVSLTPDPVKLPYTLGGYGDPSRLKNHATGIHDACYARAVVIENRGAKCALVSLDLCFLPSNVKDIVASRIGGTGIA